MRTIFIRAIKLYSLYGRNEPRYPRLAFPSTIVRDPFFFRSRKKVNVPFWGINLGEEIYSIEQEPWIFHTEQWVIEVELSDPI